jgi:hypothetical protein
MAEVAPMEMTASIDTVLVEINANFVVPNP